MKASVNRVAVLWLIPLFSAAGLSTAIAAEPDLRLANAVANQDKPAIRALLKQGADVNGARVDGVTALLWAAHFNDLDTVDLLLKAGAKVNAADDHGVTPLAQASENANTVMVEKLLAAGADPNRAQTSGLTPLMTATHTGSLPVVKALLAHGANVDATTTDTRDTALMWAIADQHGDVARALIEARADVHVVSRRGFTPMMFAARNGDIAMAKALMAAGVTVNETPPDGTHVLPFAIVSGQDELASFLIERGADPNGSMGGIRALHAAAGGVDLWLGDWNRQHGGAAGLFAGGSFGRAPRGALKLVQALLAKGADPNARITTSAMLMSYVGYPKKGAFEPFACGTGDLRGATPLWVAAYAANGNIGSNGMGNAGGATDESMAGESSTGILKALLTAGANPRLTTDDGTTPLMVAAGLGRSTFIPGLQRGRRSTGGEQAVTVLLEAGADVNAVNEADFVALHGAAYRGLNEVIQILVEHGANINARDFRGRTPFRLRSEERRVGKECRL